MKEKKQNFLSCLLSYAREGKQKLILSVILSVVSITAGLVPYYCFYRILCLFLNGSISALFRAVHHGEPLRGIPYFGRIAEPRGGALSARASGGSDETQHRRNQGNYGG